MKRYSLLAAIVFACVSTAAHANDLMSRQTAARLGLEVVWTKQLSVSRGADSIVDQQIHVHNENPLELVEVVGKAAEGEEAPVYFRIATDELDPTGLPIGKPEAERLARREIRRLARRNLDLTIESRTTPRLRLYTASDNGMIECRDAETGDPIWATQVGDRQLTWGKMGINEDFLTITNGANLIKINVQDGKWINTVRTTRTPLYGAIHAGDFSVVPTIRNGVEGYPLDDTTRDPFMEIVAGIALKPPTKSPSSAKIAWGTDRGFVYVMETSGDPSVLFRLDTDGIVSGRIASAAGDEFYFGSESGQIYGLRATRAGSVLWSKPYGEPFYQGPLIADDTVLLVSAYWNLFAINRITGNSVWEAPVPNVEKLIAAFDGKVFARFTSGALGIVDLKTGEMIELDHTMRPEKLFINRISNRLYFVNSIGTAQCLRPIGAVVPTVRSAEAAEEVVDDQQPTGASPAKPSGGNPFQKTDPFGAAPADPFGAGNAPAADPFGAGAGDAKMDDDPFGNPGAPADDPFGAPPAGGGNDPFGGDPFGN